MEREPSFPDSFRFLTALAADHVDPAIPVPDDPDIASLAVEHRMHGLVMTAIEARPEAPAEALRRELALIDGQTWARHQFLATELAWVSSALTTRGIDHYLMKGLAVETRFYDRRGERPSADLDIVLLDRSSIGDALAALRDGSGEADVVQRLADDGWIQSVDVTLPSGAVVDLHLDPLKLGFATEFSSSMHHHLELLTVDGAVVKTLDPTASLVVALVHLNRNRFRYLLGFADIVRVLSKSQVDWVAFDQLVRADGLEVLVEGSVRAVRQALGPAAADFGGWSPQGSIGLTLRRAIWSFAWRPSTRLTGTAGRFRMGRRSQFLMPALCRGRAWWLVRWMGRRLFPPTAVVDLNHPDVSGPYLIRLIRGRWNEIRHARSHRRDRREDSRGDGARVVETSE